MHHEYGISVGKPPLASRNVICFLKLVAGVLFKPFQIFFFFLRGEEVGGEGWLTLEIPTIRPSTPKTG